MTVARRVLLDTNILVAATDRRRAEHALAVAALNEWPVAGTTLYTSGQILREYLSVATRPAAQNGLGLSQPDALANALRSGPGSGHSRRTSRLPIACWSCWAK
jgi:predicted nucleic acid-binding protein